MNPNPGPAGADPVATARRVLLTRRLLSAAVRRYELALDFCREVDASMPGPFRPPFDPHAEPADERRAWWSLLAETEADFYAAECALAERISNLYDALASEGARLGPPVAGAEFPERAVTLDGRTYVLMDDPGNFEAGTTIVARVPVGRTIDLDG